MEGLICDKISKMFMVEFRGWYMDVHCKMYSFCTCDIFHNFFLKLTLAATWRIYWREAKEEAGR